MKETFCYDYSSFRKLKDTYNIIIKCNYKTPECKEEINIKQAIKRYNLNEEEIKKEFCEIIFTSFIEGEKHLLFPDMDFETYLRERIEPNEDELIELCSTWVEKLYYIHIHKYETLLPTTNTLFDIKVPTLVFDVTDLYEQIIVKTVIDDKTGKIMSLMEYLQTPKLSITKRLNTIDSITQEVVFQNLLEMYENEKQVKFILLLYNWNVLSKAVNRMIFNQQEKQKKKNK